MFDLEIIYQDLKWFTKVSQKLPVKFMIKSYFNLLYVLIQNHILIKKIRNRLNCMALTRQSLTLNVALTNIPSNLYFRGLLKINPVSKLVSQYI